MQKHIYFSINEIKSLLSGHAEDKEAMKVVFNDYMRRSHACEPGDDQYKSLVKLFKTKGGLGGYLEFMGVR